MLSLRTILFLGIIHGVSNTLAGQALPPRLRRTLTTQLKASEQDLRAVEGGRVVAYSVDSGAAEDVMLVGMTRIWAPPEAFVRRYRDIMKFESAPGVIAGGKFSLPPGDADLSGLRLSKKEADELRKCKPGDCAFKIGDSGMQFLHKTVNWNSPDYVEQATKALRALWLQYLTRYQTSGNGGLVVYHDAPQYSSIERGLDRLLARATALDEYAPQLTEYLRNYPRSANTPTEEFFYWQIAEFGLKPVHRVTHVVIQRTPATFGDAYVIAAKMLFASHYFRSALEIRFLIPGQDQHIGGMHYLVMVQRSYVDGLTGLRGRFLRGFAVRRARQTMERYLANAKAKVEIDFKQHR